ncbi:uncharacterized protein LOC124171196 [Ischnura elegans]|uniref:uncharacterized protein LOC124171196 n=1 Tax=Ischnura elegans TaxID=197161 RepID=UPI001ED88264|nr:uncharacterized protein LOC124171196 [Ischnura elegans]
MTEEILATVKAIDNKQTELCKALLICQSTVNDHGWMLDNLSKFVSNAYDQFMDISREMSDMKINFQTFQYQLNALEQVSLRSTLEIHGIPYRQGESAMGIVGNVCRVLKARVDERDVEYAYRITFNGPADGRIAPIVVRFSRSLHAERLMKAKKLKRNLTTGDLGMQDCAPIPFFINFRLTTVNRKIFSKAWQLKKQGVIKCVWIRHGKIFARREDGMEKVHIRNEFEVDVLFAKAEISD